MQIEKFIALLLEDFAHTAVDGLDADDRVPVLADPAVLDATMAVYQAVLTFEATVTYAVSQLKQPPVFREGNAVPSDKRRPH